MGLSNVPNASGVSKGRLLLIAAVTLSLSLRANADSVASGLDGLAVQVDNSPCVSFQAEDVAMLTTGAGELLGLVTVRSGATPGAPLRPSGVTLMRLDIQLLQHPRRAPNFSNSGPQPPPVSPDPGVFFARAASMAPVLTPGRPAAAGSVRNGGRPPAEAPGSGRQLQGASPGASSAEAEGGDIAGGALLGASSDAGAAAAVAAGVSEVTGRTGNDTYPIANVMVSLSRRVPDACPSRVPALRAAAAVDCRDVDANPDPDEPGAHAAAGQAGSGAGGHRTVLRRASMLVEVPTSLFRCAPDDTETISRSFFVQLRVDVSRREECGADDSQPVYAGEAANEISPGCSYLLVTGECKPESCPPQPPPPPPEQVQLQAQALATALAAADPLEPGQQQQAAEARQLLSMAEALSAAAGAAGAGAGAAGVAGAVQETRPKRRAMSDLAQEVVPADGDGIGIGSGTRGGSSVAADLASRVGGVGAGGAGVGAALRRRTEESGGLLAVVLHGHGPALDELAPAATATGAATAADGLAAGVGAMESVASSMAPGVTEPGQPQGAAFSGRLEPAQVPGSGSAVQTVAPTHEDDSSTSGSGGTSGGRSLLDSSVALSQGGDTAWADPDARHGHQQQERAPNCTGIECRSPTRARWLLFAAGGVIGTAALATVIAALLMRSRSMAAAAAAAAAVEASAAAAGAAKAVAAGQSGANMAPLIKSDSTVAPLAAFRVPASVPAHGARVAVDGDNACSQPTSPTTFDTSGSVAGISPAFAGSHSAAAGSEMGLASRPSWDGRLNSSSSGAAAYAQTILGRSGSNNSTTAAPVVGPAAPYTRSGSSNSAVAVASAAPYNRSESGNSTVAATSAAAAPYNRTGSSNSTSGGGAAPPIVVISRDGSETAPLATSASRGALLNQVGSDSRGGALAGSGPAVGVGVVPGFRPQLLPDSDVATAASSPTPASYVPHSMHASFSSGAADVYSPRRNRWLPPQAAGSGGAFAAPGSPAVMSHSFTQGHTVVPQHVLSPRPPQQQQPSSPAFAPGAVYTPSSSSRAGRRLYVSSGEPAAAAGAGSAAFTEAPGSASVGTSAAAGPPPPPPPLRTKSTDRLATILSTSNEDLPLLPPELVAAMQQQVYARQELQQRLEQQQQQQQQQGVLPPLGLQPLGALRDVSDPQSGSTGPGGTEPPSAPRQASSSAASSLSWAVGGNGSCSTPRMAARGAQGGGSSAPVELDSHFQELRQQQHQDALGSAGSTYSRFSVSAVPSRQPTEAGGAGVTSEPGAAAEAAPSSGSVVSWDVDGICPRKPLGAAPAAAAPFSPSFQQYGAPGDGRGGSRPYGGVTHTASATASPLRPAGAFSRGSMPTAARPSVPASPSQQLQVHRLPEALLAQLQPLGSPVTPPSAASRAAKQRFLHQQQHQQRRLQPGAKQAGGALLGAFDSAATSGAPRPSGAFTSVASGAGPHGSRGGLHGGPAHGVAPAPEAMLADHLGGDLPPNADGGEPLADACEEQKVQDCIVMFAATATAAAAAAASAAVGVRGVLSPLHRHEVLDEALLPASGPGTAQHEGLHLGEDGTGVGAAAGPDDDVDEEFVSAALFDQGPSRSAKGSFSEGVSELALRTSSISHCAAGTAAATAAAAAAAAAAPTLERARRAGVTEDWDGEDSSATALNLGRSRWSVPVPMASQGSITSIGGGVAISLQLAMQLEASSQAAAEHPQQQYHHPHQQHHSSAHGEHVMPRRAATHGKSFHRLVAGSAIGSSPTTLDGGGAGAAPLPPPLHQQQHQQLHAPVRLASFTSGGGPAAAATATAAVTASVAVRAATATTASATASASSTPPLYTRASVSGTSFGAPGQVGWGGSAGCGTPPLQPGSGVQSAAATAPTSPYALVGVTGTHAPGRERAFRASGDVELADGAL